jgi:hypothetical protein
MDNDNLFELPPQDAVDRSKIAGKLLSNVYEVTRGGFGKDEDNIIAYSGSLRVSELFDDFEFFETLSRSKNWPISKIIQREIDTDRVKNIEEGYIRSNRKVKYFPPIVVAILPKENDQLADCFLFDESPESVESAKKLIFDKSIFKPINEEFYSNVFSKSRNFSSAKGLYVLELFRNSNYYALSWDTESYFAIAIDGQHRMSALIESYKLDKSIGNYKQDVIFLDLSLKSRADSLTPVNIVRTIFIDINKNPRQVNRSRQILMDDLDTAALLVQTLVNDDDEDGGRKGRYLRPQIIDWYSEDQKFELPYCTSIINLWEILNTELLSNALLNSLDDFKNVKKVTAWKDQIDNLFKVDKLIEEIQEFNGIVKLKDSYKLFKQKILNDGETPEGQEEDNDFEYFNFDYDILRVIAFSFENTYSSSIVKFFNENELYRSLTGKLDSEGAFDRSKTVCHALTISRTKRTDDQNKQFDSLKRKLTSSLGEDYYYLYTVLGQKAIFKYFFKGLISQIGNVVDEPNCLKISSTLIEDFNLMFNQLKKSEFLLFSSKDYSAEYGDFVKDYIKSKALDDKIVQLERVFWNDLIVVNNQILYKQRGIDTFYTLIRILIAQVKKNINEKRLGEEFTDIPSLSAIGYFAGRVKKRIELETKTQQLSSVEIDDLTTGCIEVKTAFLTNLIKASFEKE